MKVSTGEWVGAQAAARELGPFTVLTSDNPFSNELHADEENCRASHAEGCSPTCNVEACDFGYTIGSRPDGRLARGTGLRVARSRSVEVRSELASRVGPVRDL